MPAVADTLARAKIDVTAIERVVCGAGPGSFTSLRIAGAIAKGIANGVGCPLFPIPSMALIVGGDQRAPGRYLAAIDALRNEFYVGLYRGRSRRRDHRARARSARCRRRRRCRRRGVRRQGHRSLAASRSDRGVTARARRDATRADACRDRSGRHRELGAGLRASRRSAGSVGIGARAAVAGGMRAAIAVVTEKDLPAIAVIEREAFTDPWSEKSFREALAHPSIYFVAARGDAGEVLGYVVAWFVADEGQIANLAVAPSGWGQRHRALAARRGAPRGGAAQGDRSVFGGAGFERTRSAVVSVARVRGSGPAARILSSSGRGCHRATAHAEVGGCVK